ncbi:MAG TPA: hypothetical protein VK196_10360, partial [Magnetospirillum sp.]|nr:hypothetical protein [Magnetospirillum sp.]
MTIFGYDARDAAQFAVFAELAGGPLDGLSLPPAWSLVKTFHDSLYGGQGYVAVGPLPSTGDNIAVVAMGATWDDFTQNFPRSAFPLVPLPFVNAALAEPALAVHRALWRLTEPQPAKGDPGAIRAALTRPGQMLCASGRLKTAMAQWLAAAAAAD